MRWLVYGDLQTTDGDERCYRNPGVSLQHYRVSRFFDEVICVYDKYKCDGIIDLGDTTDDRSAIPMPTINLLGAALNKLPDGNNFKLTGNHEQFLRDCTIDNRHLFTHKFHVISNRLIVRDAGYDLFFCAYPADHRELAEWIVEKAKLARGPRLLFGHFQVAGAFLNNTKTTSGVPLEALKSFDAVLLGHIHQPQMVNERVHYVGSPFQQDWGETNQKKQVILLDTNPLTITPISLSGYPQYRQITLDEFKQVAQEQSEDRYRVVLKNHEETEEFFKHPAFNRATAHYSYEEAEAETPAAQEQDWTFDGICRRYLSLVPPDKVGISLSPEEMLTIGKSIAEE
jgi:hypothetical protein